MEEASRLAKEQKVSLDDFLFGSDIGERTRKSYTAEWGRICTWLAEKGCPDYAGCEVDELADLMHTYLKEKCTSSSSGNFVGVVDLASASVNYHLMAAGHASLNPFKTERVRRLRKSVCRSCKKVRDAKIKKSPISEEDGRHVVSHNLRVDVLKSSVRCSVAQLALLHNSLLSLIMYKGCRGDSVRASAAAVSLRTHGARAAAGSGSSSSSRSSSAGGHFKVALPLFSLHLGHAGGILLWHG
jgi:hypothetical protein